MAPELLFLVQDVAREGQCSAGLVRKETRSGRLNVAFRTPNGTRLFRLSDVRAFAEQRRARRRARRTMELPG